MQLVHQGPWLLVFLSGPSHFAKLYSGCTSRFWHLLFGWTCIASIGVAPYDNQQDEFILGSVMLNLFHVMIYAALRVNQLSHKFSHNKASLCILHK